MSTNGGNDRAVDVDIMASAFRCFLQEAQQRLADDPERKLHDAFYAGASVVFVFFETAAETGRETFNAIYEKMSEEVKVSNRAAGYHLEFEPWVDS